MRIQTDQDNVRPSRTKTILRLTGLLVLLPLLCCCLSHRVEPLNDAYYFAFGRYYYDRAEEKVAEFHQLNEKIMAKMPVYPGATLEGEGMKKTGVTRLGDMPIIPGPVTLGACYKVDASILEVLDFYHKSLTKDGWELVEDDTLIIWRVYYKDSACVRIRDTCYFSERFSNDSADHLSQNYRLEVYYDLNLLLSFPGVPDGGCP